MSRYILLLSHGPQWFDSFVYNSFQSSPFYIYVTSLQKPTRSPTSRPTPRPFTCSLVSGVGVLPCNAEIVALETCAGAVPTSCCDCLKPVYAAFTTGVCSGLGPACASLQACVTPGPCTNTCSSELLSLVKCGLMAGGCTGNECGS